MKCFALLLLSACCAFGQLTLQQMQPWFSGSPLASRWYPTNSANPTMLWGEMQLYGGKMWGPDNTTTPVGDNVRVNIWTNLATAGGVGSKWTADQTLHPTNFISGGGANGTSPRILFTASTDTRLAGGSLTASNMFTVMLVANCTATTGFDFLLQNGAGTPWIRYNAKGLEINQGTTLSSPTTLTAGQWYVITGVFAAGASSHIDTNGVQMVSGTAGTGNSATFYIATFGTTTFRGSISRVWGWYGVLSPTDLAAAVAQCKTDFGIP